LINHADEYELGRYWLLFYRMFFDKKSRTRWRRHYI